MEFLIGCLAILLILPLVYAGLAYVFFFCINMLYPLPFLATWGFTHYIAAGFLLSFISGSFRSSVKVEK